jgi:site-specific recombinase XerD
MPGGRESGVADSKWHEFRHTFLSRLRQSGVPLETIDELAGHKSLATTKHYAHVAAEHLYDAVERLTAKTTATRTATGAPVAFATDAVRTA